MHRPTHDPARDKAGDYPFSWHMAGRKRIWEVRLQISFKRIPTGKMFFGVEMQPAPNHGSASHNRIKSLLLRVVRGCIGDGFYETPGDDPTSTVGEVEPPTFAMPFWAMDQFHVAEPGEQPDMLGDLSEYGTKRTDGMKAYVAAMQNVMDTLSTEKVYTFCFWGVSQFVDAINWEFRGLFPGLKVDVNSFVGTPPIYIAAYALQDDREQSEVTKPQRHYMSQKQYIFKVALWTNKKPPQPEVLAELLGPKVKSSAGAVDGEASGAASAKSRRRFPRVWPLCNGSADVQPSRSKARSRWVGAAQGLFGSCMGAEVRR